MGFSVGVWGVILRRRQLVQGWQFVEMHAQLGNVAAKSAATTREIDALSPVPIPSHDSLGLPFVDI